MEIGEREKIENVRDDAMMGIILLAAGNSSRLGQPKQLLTYENQTLIRRAAQTALASKNRPIVVVLGANAERMRPELEDFNIEIVICQNWENGMSASLQTGLTRAENWDAAVVMLCDQPLLTAEILNELAEKNALAACEYDGQIGVPACFPKKYFPELQTLGEKSGAKAILKKYAAEVVTIPFPNGKVDVDTPDDYARLVNRS